LRRLLKQKKLPALYDRELLLGYLFSFLKFKSFPVHDVIDTHGGNTDIFRRAIL